MKTRLDRALKKLYTAFHEGTLDAMNCQHCAVGNLCDNNENWADVISCGNTLREVDEEDFNKHILFYSRWEEDYQNGLKVISDTGYSPYELMKVEAIFLDAHVLNIYDKEQQKDLQFKGLCEVVKYLAELDGVENPMEIMELFKNKELVL